MSVVSRTFTKDTVTIKTLDGKTELFKKPVESATAVAVLDTINEFTDKHWDKKTPYKHEVEQEFEVYEMSDEDFKKSATKLEGEALQKRVAQIQKQREKRASK